MVVTFWVFLYFYVMRNLTVVAFVLLSCGNVLGQNASDYQPDCNGDGCYSSEDLLCFLGVFGLCNEFQCGDVIDYMGYSYETQLIGDQCWFKENLRTSLYKDGSLIPFGLTPDEWVSSTTGATGVYGEWDEYCSHNSPLIDACDEEQSLEAFGRLYNAYAVIDNRGLCPAGWRVPTDTDWRVLEMEIGLSAEETLLLGLRGSGSGAKLRSINGWEGMPGTDDFGFTGLPVGIRALWFNGNWEDADAGTSGSYWTSSTAWTEYIGGAPDSVFLYRRVLRSSVDGIARDVGVWNQGSYVRCLSGSQTLGCTDPDYLEFDLAAEEDDNSCETLIVAGCMIPFFLEYNPNANVDDYSCSTFIVLGCTNPNYMEFDPSANQDNGSCLTLIVEGCTDPLYEEFDPAANQDDGSCMQLSSANCQAPTMDGYSYAVVEINGTCWFAENLRTSLYRDGQPIDAGLEDVAWLNNFQGATAVYGEGSSFCNAFNPAIESCDSLTAIELYGRLYNGLAVVNPSGICPSGWHVPTRQEWIDLESYIGETNEGLLGLEGYALKNDEGWLEGENGVNAFGFAGLPGGWRNPSGSFNGSGASGLWWTSTLSPSQDGLWYALLGSDNVITQDSFNAWLGGSVRCTRPSGTTLGCTNVLYLEYNSEANVDDGSCLTLIVEGCTDALYLEYSAAANVDDGSCTSLIIEGCMDPLYEEFDPAANEDNGSCMTLIVEDDCESQLFECGGVVDYQGYAYGTTLIGGQCWFSENLRSQTYTNGDAIPSGLSADEWIGTTEGAVSVYDEGVEIASDFLAQYGRLYNWYAVDDERGLCPNGWHIPSDTEWNDLEDFIAGEGYGDAPGAALKSANGWYLAGNGSDAFGFNGRPGGIRDFFDGAFEWEGSYAFWWSSTFNAGLPWDRNLYWGNAVISRDDRPRGLGASVRCLQDEESCGCTDANYFEFDASATVDDGSCSTLIVEGCMDPLFAEFDPLANFDDGSCLTQDEITLGCTDPAFVEYSEDANVDDGSCLTEAVSGCTDPDYIEYSSDANVDDGSCLTFAGANCIAPTFDGHTYEVVMIGGQCWFAENLRTTTYADGSVLGSDASLFFQDVAFNPDSLGASTVYGAHDSCIEWAPDIDACDEEMSLESYGRLYNWWAVQDSRNLCPSGWHVPSLDDWTALEERLTYLGYVANQGAALQSSSGWADYGVTGESGTTIYYESPGFDAVGFSALAGGFFNMYNPQWSSGAGAGSSWWSSTEVAGLATSLVIAAPSNSMTIIESASDGQGRYVRCIQD